MARYFEKPIKNNIIYFTALLFLSAPYLSFILLDNSLWEHTDILIYGIFSVDLYAELFHFSPNWFFELFEIIKTKAPMILWLGQFFVPIGQLIGSIDKGLLLMIYLFFLLSIFLFYCSLNEIFKNRFASIIGCLVVIAAPLNFSLSTAFWVEPMQLFAVVWFIYIYAFAKRWDRFYAFLQLVCATSFAMLVKISSPIYCFLPGIITLYRFFGAKCAEYTVMKIRHWFSFVAAVLLGSGCVLWYWINWKNVTAFVEKSASEKYWGHSDLFYRKLGYWIYSFIDSFFMPYAFCIFLLLFLLIFFVYIKKKNLFSVRDNRFLISFSISDENIFAAMGLVHIAGVLFIFCNAVNEDVRYLLPLLPYVAVLISWTLYKFNNRWIYIFACFVLLGQLSIFTLETFNSIKTPDFPFAKLSYKWKKKLHTDKMHIREYDVIHERLKCDGKSLNVVTALPNKNIRSETIKYYLKKKVLPEKLTCNFSRLWGMYKNKKIAPDKLYEMLMDMKPDYYIAEKTISQWAVKTFDMHNNSGVLLEKIKHSDQFKQIPLSGYPDLLIFKYVGARW